MVDFLGVLLEEGRLDPEIERCPFRKFHPLEI